MESIVKKVKDFKFDHLEDKKIGYCSHFGRAMYMGVSMIWSGSLTIIHAIYPDVFKTAATDRTIALNKILGPEIDRKKKE